MARSTSHAGFPAARFSVSTGDRTCRPAPARILKARTDGAMGRSPFAPLGTALYPLASPSAAARQTRSARDRHYFIRSPRLRLRLAKLGLAEAVGTGRRTSGSARARRPRRLGGPARHLGHAPSDELRAVEALATGSARCRAADEHVLQATPPSRPALRGGAGPRSRDWRDRGARVPSGQLLRQLEHARIAAAVGVHQDLQRLLGQPGGRHLRGHVEPGARLQLGHVLVEPVQAQPRGGRRLAASEAPPSRDRPPPRPGSGSR